MHDRLLVVQAVDGGVVRRVEPDEQVRPPSGAIRRGAAAPRASMAAPALPAQPAQEASAVSAGGAGHGVLSGDSVVVQYKCGRAPPALAIGRAFRHNLCNRMRTGASPLARRLAAGSLAALPTPVARADRADSDRRADAAARSRRHARAVRPGPRHATPTGSDRRHRPASRVLVSLDWLAPRCRVPGLEGPIAAPVHDAGLQAAIGDALAGFGGQGLGRRPQPR